MTASAIFCSDCQPLGDLLNRNHAFLVILIFSFNICVRVSPKELLYQFELLNLLVERKIIPEEGTQLTRLSIELGVIQVLEGIVKEGQN
jgi:hypothetical protein